MFERLINSLRAAGLEASAAEMFAGDYFDGADHGRAFPVVRVLADYDNEGTAARLLHNWRGLVYDSRLVYGGRLFTVWASAADRDQARRLNNRARAFLDAFWMAIHDDERARDDNAAGAIAAGRAAVAAMGEV